MLMMVVVVVSGVEAEHAGVVLVGSHAQLLAKANVKIAKAAENQWRARVHEAREAHGGGVEHLREVGVELEAALVEKGLGLVHAEERASAVEPRRRDLAHVNGKLLAQLEVEALELMERAVDAPRRLELLRAKALALEHDVRADAELGVLHDGRVKMEALDLDHDAQDRRDVAQVDAQCRGRREATASMRWLWRELLRLGMLSSR